MAAIYLLRECAHAIDSFTYNNIEIGPLESDLQCSNQGP